MSDKFTKEMEQKFKKDLENMVIDNNQSQDDLQSSTDFFQSLKKKINTQITQIKTNNNASTNLALQQIKQNINNQEHEMTKFSQEIQQVKLFNQNHQNIIDQEKVTQIKLKVARQANLSKIVFTQEAVVKEMEIELQAKKMQEKNLQKQKNSEINNVSFNKKKPSKIDLQDNSIKLKIQNANLQRQRVTMQREDELSMKYQMQVLSDFFKQRFYQPIIQKVYPEKPNIEINLKVKAPKSTFSNLTPLANNQANVLPKNSPEIALKNLKKNKKIKQIQPISKTTIKISFKKQIQQQQKQTFLSKKLQIQGISQNVSLNKKTSNNNDDNSQKSQNTHVQILVKYFKTISKPLEKIESISQQYKPKFLKHHLNQNQKTSNIDISQIEGDQKSLSLVITSQLLQLSQNDKNAGDLKQFKLTFQDITDLKGIQAFKNIEYAALQHNMIKDINGLRLCEKLIQLNLSNNSIKSCKDVQNLPWLRFINMNNNKLKQLQLKGGSIQIAFFNKNKIQKIINLNKNKNLRILHLNQNNLHQISGFEELYFLQQLLLNKNYIKSLKGTQQLILLQRLQISHNRIEQIQKQIIFLYLNILDLSFNKIQAISGMFLPSLQKLYLLNNKLKGNSNIIQNQIFYLPQLKQFNIDDNQLQGFSGIWSFIRYSQNLQIIKYDNNEYFLSVRQKVRQLYQAIIYKNMSNLKILNHSPMDSGMKAYYDSMYRGYLKNNRMFQKKHDLLNDIQKLITFLLKESKTIFQLQSEQSIVKNQRFVESNLFIYYKSIKKAQSLIKLSETLMKKIAVKQNKQSKTTIGLIKKQNNHLLNVNSSIYYFHDRFEAHFLKKIHKIKSLYYRYRYKMNKRRKYFLKNKEKISKQIEFFNIILKQNSIKKVVQKFEYALKALNQNDAAIMIQKCWKGYKIRKIFKKMLKKLRKNNFDDDFQLQEVDLDDFECHQFPQFDFNMPQNVHFDQYIIQPKYFQLAQIQKKKRNQRQTIIQQKHEEEQQREYKPLLNNFMQKSQEASQIRQRKKKEAEDQDARIMKEWGFTDPKSLQMMRLKGLKKQQRAKKQALKNLTAEQRLAKFKNQKY